MRFLCGWRWSRGAGFAHPAQADDFYKGKAVTIVVGFSAGGGFDINARLMARYIGRYIPGAPDVVVVNLPGAGSETAIVRLDGDMAKDGTVINTFNFGLINDSLLQPQKSRVDFRNYAWIGSISEDLTVCYILRADGPKTLADMKSGHYFFGLTGTGTSEDINTKILKRIFGIDVGQVAGYPGSADIRVAIERGELDGDCGAWSSIPEDYPRARNGSRCRARAKPSRATRACPTRSISRPTTRKKQVMCVLPLPTAISGCPLHRLARCRRADRVRILRDAFAAAVKDPEFIAEAKKLRLPVSPRTGEEAAKVIDAIYATPPDIVAAARKVVQ